MNRISRLALSLACAITACVLVGPTSVLTADSPRTLKIVYTNDTLGYIEPCGCGGRMQGGLARRTTAIADMLKADPNVVIVDSGNLSNMQSKIDLVVSAMANMKYDAIGIGAADRLFSDEFFKQTASKGLKVIDTTVPKSATTIPYLIKRVGGVKVGIVSFGKDTATPGDSKLEDLTTFYKSYKTARDSSDILVLLDQGNIARPEWLEGDAGGLGAPDVVISGAARGFVSKEKIIGRTHIVPVTQLGKLLGIIDVDLSDPESPVISTHTLMLDRKIAEDEAVKKQVEDFLQGPKALATLSPRLLNFGSVNKGTKKEEYVILTPKGSAELTLKNTSSTSDRVTAPDWTRSPDGSYKIRIVIDGGDATGRMLETVSIAMDLPGEPTLNLRVFGNVVDE